MTDRARNGRRPPGELQLAGRLPEEFFEQSPGLRLVETPAADVEGRVEFPGNGGGTTAQLLFRGAQYRERR